MPQATQAKPWLETLDIPALTLVSPLQPGDLDTRLAGLKQQIRTLREIEQLEKELRRIERRIGSCIPERQRRQMEIIKAAVLEHFGLSGRELHADTRRVESVWPRQVCFYLARRLTNASLTMIGGWLRRDHATVLYSVRAVEAKMQTERQARENVEALEAQIRSRLTTDH